MDELNVKVDETLVLAKVLIGNSWVRLSDPDNSVSPVPETLMVIETIPDQVRRFVYPQRIEQWVYVRYVMTRGRGDGAWVEGLEFGPRYRVPLDDLPVGMAVRVQHIPLYALPTQPVKIWPYWKLPPKKKWLVVPRRGAH